MKVYLSIFRMRVINGLQYRTVAFSAIVTRFFWALMEILAYDALFQIGLDGGMTFEQTVSYVWMQQALYSMFLVVSGDGEIYDTIRSGSIAYELVRPMDLYGKWFFQAMANRVVPTLTNYIPMLLIAFLMPSHFRLTISLSFEQLILFLLSCILALGVVVSCAMLMYISLFYLTSQRGIKIIVTAITTFFSGGVIPLTFFPDKVRAFSNLLPFAAMQNMPLQIYCGSISGNTAYRGILFQLIWVVILVGGGYVAMNRVLKKVVVQGG